jgi:hypothetical protein
MSENVLNVFLVFVGLFELPSVIHNIILGIVRLLNTLRDSLAFHTHST